MLGIFLSEPLVAGFFKEHGIFGRSTWCYNSTTLAAPRKYPTNEWLNDVLHFKSIYKLHDLFIVIVCM
jgi:hypothetical protein